MLGSTSASVHRRPLLHVRSPGNGVWRLYIPPSVGKNKSLLRFGSRMFLELKVPRAKVLWYGLALLRGDGGIEMSLLTDFQITGDL